MRTRHLITIAFCAGPIALPAAALAQHAGDVWVGRSAGGQLKIHPQGFVPDENYRALDPVEGPFYWGWLDSNPGFDRVVDPEPEEDILPMESGAQIWLVVVETGEAFKVVDLQLTVYEDPGDAAYLGDHTLHTHELNWVIDRLDPGYDADQCVWHGTFFLRDEGSTGYADSAAFTFSFTNVALREADGDFNEDFVVDLEDAAAWPECMAGPEQRPDPDDPAITLCEVDCTNAFDFDGDLDVDLGDFAGLQNVFGL